MTTIAWEGRVGRASRFLVQRVVSRGHGTHGGATISVQAPLMHANFGGPHLYEQCQSLNVRRECIGRQALKGGSKFLDAGAEHSRKIFGPNSVLHDDVRVRDE